MITVWNFKSVTGFQKKCRDTLLLDLLGQQIDDDLHLIFGIKFGGLDGIDLMMAGPSGFVIGELHKTHTKISGSFDGNWSFVRPNGNAVVYRRDKNPFQQAIERRENLEKTLLERGTILINQNELSFDWCNAGLVQVPKHNMDIRGIDRDWWYACGFQDWLSFALDKVCKTCEEKVNFEGFSNWLLAINSSSFSLDDALVALNIHPTKSPTEYTTRPSSGDFQYSTEQQEALDADADKPLVIIAGPGSGKTRVLTGRVQKLKSLLGKEQWMAVITYTNAAKNEIKHRLNFDKKELSNCFIGTVHQLAKYLLDRHAESKERLIVLDEYESVRRLMQFGDIDQYEADKILRSNRESLLLDSEQKELYSRFVESLNSTREATFDSLIMDAANLSLEGLGIPPSYIVIDEYQDSNKLQIDLFKALSNFGSILNVVGDPEQAIYCRPDQINNFQATHKNAVIKFLHDNYRSTREIVELSNSIRSSDDTLKSQMTVNESKRGEIVCNAFDSEDAQDHWLLNWINSLVQNGSSYREIAILSRTNNGKQRIKRLLSKQVPSIPVYEYLDYRRLNLISWYLACLRYMQNPKSFYCLSRLFNYIPGLSDSLAGIMHKVFLSSEHVAEMKIDPDYFDQVDLEVPDSLNNELLRLKDILDLLLSYSRHELHEALEEIWDNILLKEMQMKDEKHVPIAEQLVAGCVAKLRSLTHAETWHDKVQMICRLIEDQDIEIDGGNDSPNGVLLSTMHSCKGLEWESVALIDICAGLFPNGMAIRAGNKNGERRLLHVAVSRAKTNLAICLPSRVERNMGVSDFAEYFIHLD
jgi:DNA helicase II / ATP-dependent DNA helicase PcrA